MYSKFNLNVHEFIAFDTSAKHVNYQTMCRLETLAFYEAEREEGERRGRKREWGESKREIRETHKWRQRLSDRQRQRPCQMSQKCKKKRPFCETINLESSHLRISIWASNNSTCHMLQLASWGRITQLLSVWVLLIRPPVFTSIICHMLTPHVTSGSLFTLCVSQCSRCLWMGPT